MHKHIPTISPEDYAQQVMERAAVPRMFVAAASAQPGSSEVEVSAPPKAPRCARFGNASPPELRGWCGAGSRDRH